MHKAVQALIGVLPPPVVGESAPWSDSRAEVGITFPADFRDFADVYGQGSIDDEFFVYAPSLRPPQAGWSSGFTGFLEWTTRGLGRSLADMRENAVALDNEEAFPYPIYPEPGGLILFAVNANGDMCFWDSRAAISNEWPVVIYRQSAGLWIPFAGCMSEMLLSAIERRLPDAPGLLGFSEDDYEWIRDRTWAG